VKSAETTPLPSLPSRRRRTSVSRTAAAFLPSV
jgi:hypothetical protein